MTFTKKIKFLDSASLCNSCTQVPDILLPGFLSHLYHTMFRSVSQMILLPIPEECMLSRSYPWPFSTFHPTALLWSCLNLKLQLVLTNRWLSNQYLLPVSPSWLFHIYTCNSPMQFCIYNTGLIQTSPSRIYWLVSSLIGLAFAIAVV
jgi:hypothetical protein